MIKKKEEILTCLYIVFLSRRFFVVPIYLGNIHSNAYVIIMEHCNMQDDKLHTLLLYVFRSVVIRKCFVMIILIKYM